MSNLYGDWGKLNSFMTGLNPRFLKAMNEATNENLKLGEKAVVLNLRNQRFRSRWPSYTPEYQKYKERKGLSPKMLIATATMMRSITSVKESPFEGAVGVLRRTKYRNRAGHINVANVAVIHETRKRKARKLWKPTLNEIENEVLDNYDEAMRKVVFGG